MLDERLYRHSRKLNGHKPFKLLLSGYFAQPGRSQVVPDLGLGKCGFGVRLVVVPASVDRRKRFCALSYRWLLLEPSVYGTVSSNGATARRSISTSSHSLLSVSFGIFFFLYFGCTTEFLFLVVFEILKSSGGARFRQITSRKIQQSE